MASYGAVASVGIGVTSSVTRVNTTVARAGVAIGVGVPVGVGVSVALISWRVKLREINGNQTAICRALMSYEAQREAACTFNLASFGAISA